MPVASPEQERMFARIQEERLSVEAGAAARRAAVALAQAAACEELLEDGSHSEGQLFFLCRAMCAEHGFPFESFAAEGRRYARRVRAQGA